MLDLDANREAAKPRDAATLVVVRDTRGGGGIEVFCVERQKVGFLGGAVVFPGGKLDPADMDAGWAGASTPPRQPRSPIADDEATLCALSIAACREALEEAAILPLAGSQLAHDELLAWRKRVAAGESLLSLLAARGAKLDLSALHPMARWITPVAESRRFDTRFFLYVAEAALTGAHDDHETTASFWAPPAEVIRRFETGALQLAPPTHRTLEILATVRDAVAAVALADASCLDPVCPRLVTHRDSRGDTVGLALPGDPEHDIREARSPGRLRYVLRGDRFLPEDPPA